MADLSVQFAALAGEKLTEENTQLFEKFFDAFIGSFEEQDSVKQIFNQTEFTNNEITTVDQLAAVYLIFFNNFLSSFNFFLYLD